MELLGRVKAIPEPFVVLKPAHKSLNDGIVEMSRKTTDIIPIL